jgi:hypothetical protein
VTIQCRLDDGALDTATASMDQTHLENARGRRRVDIVDHDIGDIAWRESVKVQLGPCRNAERYFLSLSYAAVTRVLIPPRTEKSPTTVMRRG